MEKDPSLRQQLEQMRRDWNARAKENAEYFVHVPDETRAGFEESGRRNFEEQIRPFLAELLDSGDPKQARVLEIGCGLGRITRWLVPNFLEVHGVDISPEMIERARQRLQDFPNVTLHVGSGMDLGGLPGSYFDLAFSYIVFQHIPSREVIANYIRETARVLKPGGAFKFQLNGHRDLEYRRKEKDSWLGESFFLSEVLDLLDGAGLAPLAFEGAGTQYLVMSARKPRALPQAPHPAWEREREERIRWSRMLGQELARLEADPPELAALATLQREFDERAAWAQSLQAELDRAREDYTAGVAALDADLAKARQDLAVLQSEFDDRTAWAKSLEAALEKARNDLATLQKEFEERTAWALQLRDQLESRTAGKK